MAAVPYVEIKAWLGAKMTPALHDFDMGAMCSFLVEQQCDKAKEFVDTPHSY